MKTAVIGLGFGDEGKGVVTEYLCSQDPANTIVVRFSGGQQAAHTVHKDDAKHVFSHFGSGTLSGCPTYWSKQCTVNPWTLMREYMELRSKGIDPELYIHPACRVTTPYDMAVGQYADKENGTTGHGIFRTIKRHEIVPLTVEMILYDPPERLDKRFQKISEYYKTGVNMDDYINAIFDVRKLTGQGLPFEMWDIIPGNYCNIVYEGSQGLMLDEKIGYMPHCTPTDVTPMSIAHHGLDEIILITRAYQSRHGNGPMTNSHLPVKLKNDENETCVFNQYQGEFRKTALDLNQLIHAKTEGIDNLNIQNVKVSLAVTCLDQLDQYIVTHHGKPCYFTTPERFVEFIADNLGITYGGGKLYLNDSPYSHLKTWTTNEQRYSA